MAFDATFGGVTAFGRQGIAGLVSPREGFLGLLSILSLRPEYRSPAEIIATESTRKWVKFQSSGDEDKTEKIKKIEAEFEFFARSLSMTGFSAERTSISTPDRLTMLRN
jgi:hypothetical protein